MDAEGIFIPLWSFHRYLYLQLSQNVGIKEALQVTGTTLLAYNDSVDPQSIYFLNLCGMESKLNLNLLLYGQ